MASLLNVRKRLELAEATMRLGAMGKREDTKHGIRSTEVLT